MIAIFACELPEVGLGGGVRMLAKDFCPRLFEKRMDACRISCSFATDRIGDGGGWELVSALHETEEIVHPFLPFSVNLVLLSS